MTDENSVSREGGRTRPGGLREKVSYYLSVARMAIAMMLIVGIYSNADQWFRDHNIRHLLFAGVLLLIASGFFLVIRDRWETAIGAFGATVLFGIVGGILHETLAVIPLTLLCALIAYLLLRWKTPTL